MHNQSLVPVEARAPITSAEINGLRSAAWPAVGPQDWDVVLSRSLGWVAARADQELVGFVNVAWDGGSHAFLLDIVVDPRLQRQGIGRRLVERAAVMAREAGADWLHVDFEPGLHAFYDACGFEPSDAGLLSLRQD